MISNLSNQRYPVICPKCAHEFWVTKSLVHEMGMLELGYGSCPKCKTALNLRFDKASQSMTARLRDEYITENKAKTIGLESQRR